MNPHEAWADAQRMNRVRLNPKAWGGEPDEHFPYVVYYDGEANLGWLVKLANPIDEASPPIQMWRMIVVLGNIYSAFSDEIPLEVQGEAGRIVSGYTSRRMVLDVNGRAQYVLRAMEREPNRQWVTLGWEKHTNKKVATAKGEEMALDLEEQCGHGEGLWVRCDETHPAEGGIQIWPKGVN